MSYHININDNQRELLRLIFPPMRKRLRRHDPFDILEVVFGTAHFVPIDGRRVVERMFSWMQNYRRLMRNY